MENYALISIGMPIFNGEATLVDTIQAILNQKYKNIELIISDNCSNDKTAEICKKFSQLDPRVRYIRQKENIGPYKNFWYVLQEAKGKYFMWNAADDQLSASALGSLYKVLEENNLIGLAFPEAIFYKNGKFIYEGMKYEYVNKYYWMRLLKYAFTVVDNSMYMGLHRTEIIRKIYAAYTPRNQTGAIYRLDWIQMLILLGLTKAKIISTEKWKREYSGIPDSTSSKKSVNRNILESNKKALTYYRSYFEALNKNPPNTVICSAIFLIFVTRDYFSNFKGKFALMYKKTCNNAKNKIRK